MDLCFFILASSFIDNCSISWTITERDFNLNEIHAIENSNGNDKNDLQSINLHSVLVPKKYPRNAFPRIEMLFSVFQRKTSSSYQSSHKSKSESTIFSFSLMKHSAKNTSQQIYHQEPKQVEILVRFRWRKWCFELSGDFGIFDFFKDFGKDFNSVFVEKNLWSFFRFT